MWFLFLLIFLPDFALATIPPHCGGTSRAVALDFTEGILNPRTPLAASIQEKAAHWVRQAQRHVARMKESPERKVEVLRQLTQAISEKVALATAATTNPFKWEVVETNAGDTALFVGAIGHFIEIRPDGSVYKGELDMTQVGKEEYFSPRWRPEGGKDGLAKKYVSVRQRVR